MESFVFCIKLETSGQILGVISLPLFPIVFANFFGKFNFENHENF